MVRKFDLVLHDDEFFGINPLHRRQMAFHDGIRRDFVDLVEFIGANFNLDRLFLFVIVLDSGRLVVAIDFATAATSMGFSDPNGLTDAARMLTVQIVKELRPALDRFQVYTKGSTQPEKELESLVMGADFGASVSSSC